MSELVATSVLLSARSSTELVLLLEDQSSLAGLCVTSHLARLLRSQSLRRIGERCYTGLERSEFLAVHEFLQSVNGFRGVGSYVRSSWAYHVSKVIDSFCKESTFLKFYGHARIS